MTSVVAGPVISAEVERERIVAFPCVYDGRADGWLGTSDHIGMPTGNTFIIDIRPRTHWPVSVASPVAFLADEVARLRDQIIEAAGLTRQEIATAIGVDRRSLSGFARGDIRPTPSRVESLRFLAKVALYASSRWGERSREVLLSARHGRTPLELVVAGDAGVFGVLDRLDASDAAISVERRKPSAAPLYLAARPHGTEVVAARQRRDPLEYEQTLADALSFDEASTRNRRGRIQ